MSSIISKYHQDCRLFSGYKPCRYKLPDCRNCAHYEKVHQRILVISLEAMGAVLRSTCLLPAIKRAYPQSHISWITLPRTVPLLENNPFIDRIIPYTTDNVLLMSHLKFDVLYSVDKSMQAGALAEEVKAKQKYGFGLNHDGVIVPLSVHASYQYDVGLNDDLKFFKNAKPETQQITETMNLNWQRDPYVFEFSKGEASEAAKYRRELLLDGRAKGVIGFNTGCSDLFPYKKLELDKAIALIHLWRKNFPDYSIALLGGPEDHERQATMKTAFISDDMVINTPCLNGLRSGAQWMSAVDLVLSGDTLGLHIAIALKKPTIAWFGVSCAQEVDLYDRGYKIIADVSCTPCWKKSCDNEPKCYNMISETKIIEYTKLLLNL